jgi:hypothetical protein
VTLIIKKDTQVTLKKIRQEKLFKNQLEENRKTERLEKDNVMFKSS